MVRESRLKVLAVAYACNPYRGSEEGVGWGWVNAIAEHHDVCVLTAEYHREDIAKAVAAGVGNAGRIRWEFVKHRPWHYRPTRLWRAIEGSICKPIMNWSYRLWQRDAYAAAGRLHREVGFDLVHLVTYVGFRFPGRFCELGIPFVWGPIGGLENTPWRFLPMLGPGGCVYYAGRNIVNSYHRRFLRGPKRAFRKAAGIIAATEGISREIERWYGRKSEVLCEIGPPPQVAQGITERRPGEPLRIAWSGLHLPGKALQLLLRALAALPAGFDWTLDVLGQGPCTGSWRQLADRLGIAGRCTWHGWVERGRAVEIMHGSHVFVITSIKDLTSTVVLEAISQGVPVVCLDHCGFADVVRDDCGLRVPVENPKQVVSGLAEAIERLGRDEPLRRRMAAAALERIRDYSWESKAAKVNAIYQQAVGR